MIEIFGYANFERKSNGNLETINRYSYRFESFIKIFLYFFKLLVMSIRYN